MFGGCENRYVVLNADGGKVLWQFNPGGLTNTGPATYEAGGTQFIAAVAGNVLYSFSLPHDATTCEVKKR